MKKLFESLDGFINRGVYPNKLSWLLDFPLRRLIISPQNLADRLHLKNNFHVLEIGPGPGYFSIEVAKRLSKGKLELIDIQSNMLDIIRKKDIKNILKNIKYKTGDIAKAEYNDEMFDVIFMITVLGEVENQQACLKNIFRALKPKGILSVTEQPGDPDFITFSKLKELLKNHGFKFVKKYDSLFNYTANFSK